MHYMLRASEPSVGDIPPPSVSSQLPSPQTSLLPTWTLVTHNMPVFCTYSIAQCKSWKTRLKVIWAQTTGKVCPCHGGVKRRFKCGKKSVVFCLNKCSVKISQWYIHKSQFAYFHVGCHSAHNGVKVHLNSKNLQKSTNMFVLNQSICF